MSDKSSSSRWTHAGGGTHADGNLNDNARSWNLQVRHVIILYGGRFATAANCTASVEKARGTLLASNHFYIDE